MAQSTLRSPGRPRSEASRRAVLEAAIALMRSTSLRELSIEGLARTAGVGKTTIYRWWPNKTAVVIEAFFEDIVPRTPFPNAPTARESITLQVASLVDEMRQRPGRLIGEIIAEGQADPSVLENLRRVFLDHRRNAARAVIERGIETGEFPATLDVELAIDLIYGPIYFRLLMAHRPLDDDFARDLPRLALQALAAR